jgi:hypothetical protein
MPRSRRLLVVGAACSSVTALSLFGAPAAAVARFASPVHIVRHVGMAVNTNQSNNWSGYNIGADYPGWTGTTFTSISGEWVVPKATQHTKGQAEDSASWVGIGGGCVNDNCSVTDNTLIQAGTEQNVSKSGAASYGTWWEIIPQPQTSTSLAVEPGQTVKVTITESTSTPGDWSIVIKNLTTGKSFSTTTPYSSSMDTAEWIEETPLEIGTTGSGLAAMPNLGSVHFKDATLNHANPKFATIDEMQLSNNGAILATPSAPNSTKNGFNDCTYKTTCAAP